MFGLFKRRTVGELIKQGKMQKLNRLLNDNSVNMKDDKGNTPLFYALKYINREALNLLFQYHVEISLGDNNELLPKLVIDTLNHEIISLMMNNGVTLHNVIEHNGEQLPTLHYLVNKKVINLQLLRFLIDRGIDINALDQRQTTPIVSAVKRTYYDKKVVELLIEYGCRLDSNAKYIEESLLYNALYYEGRSSRDAIELFDMLLPHMERVWERDQLELLNNACICRNAEIFLHLCSKLTIDTDVTILNFTAFLTAKNFTPAQQKRLIEIDARKGLNLPMDFDGVKRGGGLSLQELRYNYKQLTPVMELAGMCHMDEAAIKQLESLLKSASPIESDGRSALLIAAKNHSLDAMKLLIEYGAIMDPKI